MASSASSSSSRVLERTPPHPGAFGGPPSPRRRWSTEDVLSACISGDLETVQRVFRRNRRVLFSIHGADGCTPPLLACKHGHLELAQFFFSHGATLDDRDRDPKRQGNALHYAAWGGSLAMVQWLLAEEQGGSLDDVDIVGNTALLYAVYGGHKDVVDELTGRGRDLHEKNSKNHTALLQAACGGHLHLVQWLLEQGFSLDEADHDGNTSLLFAAWGGHLDLIHFLLANGSSLTEQNHNGHSIFLSAANGGRVEIVEWLLTQGFSLTETNNNGDTALLLAAYGGHRHLVERLLELGATLNDKNACGFTPLLSAANGGQLEMADWLLQHGAQLDEADYDGYTSLILAACGGNIELVKFFINRGASITERNGNGDTALLLAAYCGNRDLVDWLLHNGSSLAEKNDTGMGALISAANGGDVEVVELLLERIAKGGDDCGDGLEKTDEGGYTPLLLAAQRGHLEVVKVLAQFGANVKAETAIHRNTAASLALDFVEVTQYLQTIASWRPMQIAADARNKKRLLALIQAGVDTVRDYAGPTALAVALRVSPYAGAPPVEPEVVALLRSARMPWSPARHSLFPAVTRTAVLKAMLLEKRVSSMADRFPVLPQEMWMHIISFLGITGQAPRTAEQGWLPATLGCLEASSCAAGAGAHPSRAGSRCGSASTDAGVVDAMDWVFEDEDDVGDGPDSGRRARNSTSKLRCRALFPDSQAEAAGAGGESMHSSGAAMDLEGDDALSSLQKTRDDVGVLSFSSPRRFSWV